MEPVRDPQISKGQLGKVLLQKGIVNEEQLQHALKVQKEENGLLGEVLVKLGYASEEDIVQALAVQHDLPYLPLASYEIDSEIIKLIPEAVARKYHVLPVDKMGDILTVVIDNPLDNDAIKEIEALAKCKIEIFVSTNKEIKEAIELYYTNDEKNKP